MDETAPYDCRTCGACCYSPWTGNGYVLLGDSDLAGLRRREVLTVTLRYGGSNEAGQLVEKLATRRDEAGRLVCLELEGSAGRPCGCRIYDDRPSACRRLEVGSEPCREARRQVGLTE